MRPEDSVSAAGSPAPAPPRPRGRFTFKVRTGEDGDSAVQRVPHSGGGWAQLRRRVERLLAEGSPAIRALVYVDEDGDQACSHFPNTRRALAEI